MRWFTDRLSTAERAQIFDLLTQRTKPLFPLALTRLQARRPSAPKSPSIPRPITHSHSRRSRPSRLCIAPWHPFPPIRDRSPTRCAPITRSPLAPLPRPPALLSIEAGWATHSTEDPRPLRLVRRLHYEAEVCTKPTNKERPPVLLTEGRQIPRGLPSSSTDAG